jgi:hypothetical protein
MLPESLETSNTITVRVRDWFESCGTRERGRRLYRLLLDRIMTVPPNWPVSVSFEDVEFVSPSCLDEAIVTLAIEQPEVASRLLIHGLLPYTAERLKAALKSRGAKGVLLENPDSSYRVSVTT